MEGLEQICSKLRQWPRRVVTDYIVLAEECLDLCADLFQSRRLILAFDEVDEPSLVIASRIEKVFAWREEDETEFAPLVAEELDGVSFLVDTGRELVVALAGGGGIEVADPIHPRLKKEIGEGVILSISIRADSIDGRLFVIEPSAAHDVVLFVADAIGLLLGTRFEAAACTRIAVRDGVDQERVRVARDLHDGLLQSFTGVVLQLETIHSTLESSPEEARRLITEAQGIIMADQRELRRFVEQLRPRSVRREAVFDFAARLEDLRLRFQKQWGIRVTFDVEHVDPFVSTFLGQETFRLIQEALTNSAKHGRATDVRVGVKTAGSEMQIEVSDNGGGFSFHGRLTLDQMLESGTGPTTLAERVSSLNGSLIVDSTETGATITISVPLGWGGAS